MIALNNIVQLSDHRKANGLHLIPIIGDGMEPTFRRGDYALALPVSTYDGEGVYVLDVGFGPSAIYRVAKNVGTPTFTMWSDNPIYEPKEVASDWFLGAVRAKIVFAVTVVDRRLADILRGA
jgi:phage repressor protein C with HTH and peptisase S24 domain